MIADLGVFTGKKVKSMKHLYLRHILFLCFCLLTGLTASAYDVEIDEIYYNFISDEEVEVTSRQLYYSGKDYYYGDMTIPESVTIANRPYRVTRIGEYAFYACWNLSSISIPEKVTTIGYSAFCDCRSLISITIPNSVTVIDGSAFDCCNNLTSVAIGNSVTCIGDQAFSSTALTSITIPNSVTTIGESAFKYCI